MAKTRAELEAEWEAMSVAERAEALDKREIRPSLQAMQEGYEKRRRSGQRINKIDMVPQFANVYNSIREERKGYERGSEEAGTATFALQNIRLSASQQLSKKDFQRFRREIGEIK